MTINKYTVWRISYPASAFVFEAIYTICTIVIWVTLVRLYMLLSKIKARKVSKKQTRCVGMGNRLLRVDWVQSAFSVFLKSKLCVLFVVEFALCTLQPVPFANVGQPYIWDSERLYDDLDTGVKVEMSEIW